MALSIRAAIARWSQLSRWERAELGRALRHRGWSYGEISAVIPVPKGTLAGWCRAITLSPEQAAAIQLRTGSRRGVPRDTQRKRRAEVERIRADALEQARQLAGDAAWAAGTALYWGEGTKAKRSLAMSNSDPRSLRFFIGWVRRYLSADAVFVLSLHLHEGNDEEASQTFWRQQLGLPDAEFYKTFVKPAGTGHRTNRLRSVCAGY